jgi:CRP-like cAMP-binding protein
VVYVSDQAHSSLARTARAMGLRPQQVRVLPTDGRWRLLPDTVVAAVRADRSAGRIPFALCASAGSTNTGAVDPLADLFIDTRLIRTHGPGDHFGELAARDWGGSYGYARLATIRCAEPGRLLRLTSQDLQWLVDTQPTVKARLAATLAERLQNR